MALSSEEFRNRCLAAAALHGTGMRGLRDLLGQFGTERTLAESIIKDKRRQNKRNIRDLAEALEVPRAWFTEPDWRALILDPEADGPPQTLPQPSAALEQELEDKAGRRSDPTSRRSEESERGSQNG